jgi:D-glycero-D-manno-heptose 1,7-bisphosphate phosphatase
MDGTLREPLSGQKYFQHPKEQRIIVGAQIAIGAYKDEWIIVCITNQGGVATGHKSMQECIN